ncbi:diguanylate cyclase [Asanoa sp. WMMD1127]|uniref:diguanylate cyclase n=1 Tax=Asanoa sp. WMMD1127 TaxID=3016107 RepID=UPI002416849C|nr:diguanylate cyclase [Asanoa sp. WMMD1127]MDG4822371.1 diguanylate cyclase [Asanoa sp. WMMD1127]
MDQERIVRDVTTRLTRASSAEEASRVTVAALSAHTGAMTAVLLPVRDHLRCVAAAGAWQVFTAVQSGRGVCGRAFRSGRTQVVTDVRDDPDYIPIGPLDVTLDISAPLLDTDERPVGVLNVEWRTPTDVADAQAVVEAVAACLGDRITRLGGPPAEKRSEKLLRHAGALTAASTEWELMAAANDAARDISGLSAAVLVVADGHRVRLGMPTVLPNAFEARLRDVMTAQPESVLFECLALAHRHGSAYTLGETGHCVPEIYRPLIEAGVATLITVPVGPPDAGGVMLIADERNLDPDPATVNLMELLAAQAWACLDRMRTLAQLRELANSDPLTGLRHQGPFSERIRTAVPGRTALLAIDIDQFKVINDTYGHQEGDAVLVAVARALQNALRHVDELFRLGGDEFVAVLEVRHPGEAMVIAERLTSAARAIGRTVSIGVALVDADEPPERTLRRADAALYGVKRDGRDGARLAAGAAAGKTG